MVKLDPELGLKPLGKMHFVEQALLAVILIIGAVDLLYIFMAISWMSQGIANIVTQNVFSDLLLALHLQVLLASTIFLWRLVVYVNDIREVVVGKKK